MTVPTDTNPEPSTASPPRCGARTRNGGAPCQRTPVAGRSRCRAHGGASPLGRAHPCFKTGRFSKILPKDLRRSFAAAAADPELTSLVGEVALLECREIQLMQALGEGSGPAGIAQEIRARFADLKAAIRSKNENAAAAALNTMEQLLDAKGDQEAVWAQLMRVAKDKAHLASLEWKRQVDLRQVMTAAQAMVLVQALLSVVMRAVEDPEIQLEIHRGIAKLLPGPLTVPDLDRASDAPEALTPEQSEELPLDELARMRRTNNIHPDQ
jgi:hypothetical protein